MKDKSVEDWFFGRLCNMHKFRWRCWKCKRFIKRADAICYGGAFTKKLIHRKCEQKLIDEGVIKETLFGDKVWSVG